MHKIKYKFAVNNSIYLDLSVKLDVSGGIYVSKHEIIHNQKRPCALLAFLICFFIK